MPEIRRYIEACGRDTFWGLCIEARRLPYHPNSPIVHGRCDMDAYKKVPVGPDIIKLDGRHHPRVIVAKHGANRYLCTACGTWVCDKCGHKRLYANRRFTGIMSCAKRTCNSRKGTWKVGYHTLSRWWDHNDADVQLGRSTGMTGTKMAEGENASG